MAGSAASQYSICQLTVRTNALSQVKYAMFTANGGAYISTVGWTDTRGNSVTIGVFVGN